MAKSSPYTNRKRDRHSYVHFYPENWLAGVAGLPRIVWSVYFEVCLYNWGKVKAMPEALLKLTLSDMDPQQGQAIVQMLLDSEKILQDEAGAFYSVRAMEEAERAFKVWAAKVEGGRKNKKDTGTSPKGHLKDTSKTVKKLREEGLDVDDTSKIPQAMLVGELEDTSKSVPKSDDSSKIPQGVLDRTKNQEPTLDKIEANASTKNKDHEQGQSEKDDFQIMAELRAKEAEGERARKMIAIGVSVVAEHWNKLAIRHNWSQISRMTTKRQELLAARVQEFGQMKLIAALDEIPKSDYLMGRTDHKVAAPAFDWVFSEEACAKIVEGFYSRTQAEPQPEMTDHAKEISAMRAANFSRMNAGTITQDEFEAERARINALAEGEKTEQ